MLMYAISFTISIYLSALMTAQPQRGEGVERRWGPVADTQMDKTTQKKTDSTAFPITVSELI